MQVIIIVLILIIIILTYIGIIPLKKWYYLFKSKYYGIFTRAKIKLISFFDAILQQFTPKNQLQFFAADFFLYSSILL